MAREFDMLEPVNRRQFYVQPQDPSVDTFRQRFAPFGNSLEDLLDEIMKKGNDRYMVPGTPRFMDPSKIMTDQRLPPAIGAPMASSGAPPSGAFPRSTMPQMAQAPTGLPPSATAVPPGLPDPTGRSPAAQQLGMPVMPSTAPAPAAPATPPGELVLPPGFRWADEGQQSPIRQGINAASEGASRLYNKAKEALMPTAPTGQSDQFNRSMKGDRGGYPASIQPFVNNIQEVSMRLGRSPLDALPTEAVAKGLESPGNAASMARWSRAYERASTDGSLYSISALAVATKSLNNNLGTEVEPKALIASIKSERSLPTTPVTASEDAAASGGSEAAAAREVAAARLAQGARGTARAQSSGMDRPGKSQELLDVISRIMRVPGDALAGKYPYTAGMSAADYTDQPGALTPQAQLAIPAMYMAADTLGGSLPFKGPNPVAAPPPMLALPPPMRALPPPRSVPPPVETPPAVPPTPPSLADLLPAGGRRSSGHLKRAIQQRLDAGWTLTNDGQWVPPGGS
jgi:hypothetical protein